MAEEREEETLVEEVEPWAEKISQLLLFLAGSPTVPAKLLWGFLQIPISSGTLLRGEGWLKTSNSSMDSVRYTKPSSPCSSSS